jgi:cupin 2 domain-containing protein
MTTNDREFPAGGPPAALSGTVFSAPLLDELEAVRGEESVHVVACLPGVRIERIVSLDYASPEGFWYDPDDHEWVMLLRGRGDVEFEDGRVFRLEAGGSLNIPPRCRHRIARTDPESPTVWLAIHVRTG